MLGRDVSDAPAHSSSDPSLANKLPYTLAVVKNAPLISSGTLHAFRTSRCRARRLPWEEVPRKGCHVWIVHMPAHRNPQYWPELDAFLPDRWIVGPEQPLRPIEGA